MVEQAKDLKKTVSLQAGSSEAEDDFLTNVNMRAARTIGRQLAEIGDQLNRRPGDYHLNAGIHPLRVPPPVHFLHRGALYRGVLGSHAEMKTVSRVIITWLSSLSWRAEGWVTWVSGVYPPHRYTWAAGLLVVTLLAAVTVYVDF